jgi:hypothetical protein
MSEFICEKCGSTELGYQKWIYCEEKVLIRPDGQHEYFDQQIDDNKVFGVGCRFICGSCGKSPMLYGDYITDEAELKTYLKLTPAQRAEIQADYEQKDEQQAQPEEEPADDDI